MSNETHPDDGRVTLISVVKFEDACGLADSTPEWSSNGPCFSYGIAPKAYRDNS